MYTNKQLSINIYKMETPIKADFEEFSLEGIKPHDSAVVIPTVASTKHSRFGTHAYYFLNFKTGKGVCVRIRHTDIILPGIRGLSEAYHKQYRLLHGLRLLFETFHYKFNYFEQIMLMTVPHTVTEAGNGRFIISLWSYFMYFIVDLRNKTVVRRSADSNYQNHVFGAKQWFLPESDSHLYMTYSLKDSMRKVLNPMERVYSHILKRENRTDRVEEIWSGYFADYMHDILLSNDNNYLVVCELGRFSDQNGSLIPSKALILDLQNKKKWVISSVPNAAHAQFDPDDSGIVYFSNHNFQFEHTPFKDLFKRGSYTLKFFGPASVHKYRLTPNGPEETSAFTAPDLFRLTNFHVFKHRDRKILAAMGAPNLIFIADTEEMKFIRKFEIVNPDSDAYIGTFTPSFDGEKLYIQTTRSFQIVDVSSAKREFIRSYKCNHTCSNHSITSRDADW